MSKWAQLNSNNQMENFSSVETPTHTVEVPDESQWRDAFFGGVHYFNPGYADNTHIFYDNYQNYYTFDGLDINADPVWLFDNAQWMLDAGFARIAEYRDSLLSQPTEYTNPDNEVFSLKNDERTRTNLGFYETIIKLENDPLFTVRFKTEDGFKDMTGPDIQGAFKQLMSEVAKVFIAEDATLQMNETNPFKNFEELVIYFNSQLA